MSVRDWTLWAILAMGAVSAPALAQPTESALRNVPVATQPRFIVTDRDWPAEVGAASVCLWNADHLAVVSITIDDNWVPDHPWWMETGAAYGYRFTWFVIASRMTPKGGFFGSPADFVKVREAGHDVQSHTVDHFSGANGAEPLDTDTNYRQAIELIERDVPGARVRVLAYPGGANAKNDRALAAKYYIAARSTRGHLNSASQVDYMDVSSLGTSMVIDPEHYAGITHLIVRNPRRADLYRGWASYHFHGLDNPKAPTGETKKKVIAFFDYLKEQGDAFWVAPFSEVAQYGQQRDTATLTMAQVGEREWQMTLTDKMDDRHFDLPLTVKVRIDNTWTGLEAKQGASAVPVKVLEHEGAKYALVWAVPDRGAVTLRGIP